MKILFVDDQPSRLRYARDHYGRHHEFRLRRSPSAVQEVDLEWADVVSLDHDMCQAPGDEIVAECPTPSAGGACGCPTGVVVAQRIAAMGAPPPVILHTANIVGLQVMHTVLVRAGVEVARWSVMWWGRMVPPGFVLRLQEGAAPEQAPVGTSGTEPARTQTEV